MIYLHKILVFILFMAILIVIKEFSKFCICVKNQEQYTVNNKERNIFLISLSYILTIIFTGL